MRISNSVVYVLFVTAWIAGIVIAKGVWSTLCAIFIPFWAWYLFIEKIMQATGLI